MSSMSSIFNSALVGRFLAWRQGDEDDIWRTKALDILMKKINRAGQRENLKDALKAKRPETPCVTLDRSKDGRLQVMHKKMLPHVMYCRIFRWPDLQSQHELRSVPTCQWPAHVREMAEICINPYHYTRTDHSNYPPVVTPRSNEFTNAVASPQPQSPMSPESNYSSRQHSPPYMSQPYFQTPPHQQENPNEPLSSLLPFSQGQISQTSQPMAMQPYHASQSSVSSANTWSGKPNILMNGMRGDENMQMSDSDARVHSSPLPAYSAVDQRAIAMPMEINDDGRDESWCRIHYNELNQKVGESFVHSARVVFVDGYTCPVDAHRFSVCQFTNINRNRTIENVRSQIGRGIKIENDGSQIHVTNLSDHSIFFLSKNCNVENQLNQHTVVKIESGKSHKMFDQRIFESLLDEALRADDGRKFERLFSLIEHCMIKLSFVKGWGSIYKRQDVSSTPCWIDIHLLKCYNMIDQFLPYVRPNAQITSTS